MKRSPFFFCGTLLFFVFSFLCFSGTSARAEDPLLKIEVLPDQNSVKSGMMFLVHVQALNSSADTSVGFWSNTCSYEKHWVTDNAGVFIQSWTCNENTLEEITLEPGDSYQKNIILYIPKKDETGPVTFRLGFKRMSENGDVTEPLWSDPVTMNVTVPEEMKEVAPPAALENAAQAPEEALPAVPAETDETSPAAVPDPAAPAEMGGTYSAVAAEPAVPAKSQPLISQDPGVPIKIQLGEDFSIRLASNPSTGFLWKMTLPEDQKTVKFLGSEHVISEEVMPGVPGEEVFKFKALTVGEIKIDFVYERPWETKEAPTRKIFTVLVQEN